jgi:hypothetical protein
VRDSFSTGYLVSLLHIVINSEGLSSRMFTEALRLNGLALNFLVAETNIAARGKGEESLASGTALIEGCPLGSRESYIGI